MTLKTVLLEIAEFSLDELSKVKSRIDARFSMEGKGPLPSAIAHEHGLNPRTRADHEWLTLGIEHELRARGLFPDDMRLRQIVPSGYQTKCKSVWMLLLSRAGRDLSEQEKSALGKLAANALARYIGHHKALSHTKMLDGIMSVPAAIEANYPGFLQPHMLGMLIEHKQIDRGGR